MSILIQGHYTNFWLPRFDDNYAYCNFLLTVRKKILNNELLTTCDYELVNSYVTTFMSASHSTTPFSIDTYINNSISHYLNSVALIKNKAYLELTAKPILVCYRNKTAAEIAKKITISSADSFICDAHIWTSSKAIQHIDLKAFFPSNVGAETSSFFIGSLVIIKKNISHELRNGLVCVIVAYTTTSDLAQPRETFILQSKRLHYTTRTQGLSSDYFTLWDVTRKCMVHLPLIADTFLCDFCKSTPKTNCQVCVKFWTYYMQAYYCMTIYMLQGETMENDLWVLLEALEKNILVCFYLICSRVKKLNNLIVDRLFFEKFLFYFNKRKHGIKRRKKPKHNCNKKENKTTTTTPSSTIQCR